MRVASASHPHLPHLADDADDVADAAGVDAARCGAAGERPGSATSIREMRVSAVELFAVAALAPFSLPPMLWRDPGGGGRVGFAAAAGYAP
eukprot:gene9354-2588_t